MTKHPETADPDMAEFIEELAQPLCAILNYANACSRSIKTEKIQAADLADPISQIVSQTERCEVILKKWKRKATKKKI